MFDAGNLVRRSLAAILFGAIMVAVAACGTMAVPIYDQVDVLDGDTRER